MLRLGTANVRFTARGEGDLAHSGAGDVPSPVRARRRAVLDLPWTWLRQVHGARVVQVVAPGDRSGEEADAAVTTEPGCALAVFTADCAPVALAADGEGVVAVAHAGWRGLLAGVLERTVEEMRALGASRVDAAVGPCIGPECYEFGERDLDTAASLLGGSVVSRTSRGRPSLDLRAGVREALARAGVESMWSSPVCTACSDEHFSWRARREPQRQAAVVWR